MALTPSGAISLGAINTALNRSATAPISMNDAQVRFLANQDSGSVNMNAMRNKQSTAGTVTVGVYDDGKSAFYGFSLNFIGSVTSNSFFGGTLYEILTDVNAGGISFFSSGEVQIPNIPARAKIGSSTYTVEYNIQNGTQYVAINGGVFFQAGNIGQTLSFQFAQT